MRYKRIGRSGLVVSQLCLGTNTFGGGDHPFWKTMGGLEQDAVNTIVAHACEAGVNFIDTANTYAGGESEQRVGQAIADLKLKRDELVIATKGGGRGGRAPHPGGNRFARSTSWFVRARCGAWAVRISQPGKR